MLRHDATIGAAPQAARVENSAGVWSVFIALTLGGVEFIRAQLRELTAGDILAAQEASEKVVQQRDGSLALVGSPAAMGRELLCRRIAWLHSDDGTKHDGPLSTAELGRMSPEDLHALQQAADALDALLALRAGEKLAQRGRNAGGGAESDQGGPLPVSYGPVAD
jgi:phage FluMu protein gp41